MHRANISHWKHNHDYERDSSVAERRTRIVIGITATMMIIEIAAGMVFKSMALLADGWHMGTHVAAFLITAFAYSYSRRHSTDPRYSFGTGKVGVLGGFASAVVLAVVALLMASESVHRIFVPEPIRFNEAIAIAVIGLLVNLVCAFLLKDDHHHHHGHGHGHNHGHSHGHGHHHGHAEHDDHAPGHGSHAHDLNLRAAYIHVLADAMTSVTAIVALLAGKFFGWSWLDPVMGLVGSVVVAVWAIGLLRDTSGILLDRTPESSDLPEEIQKAIESDGDSLIADLHVWQVSSGKFAAIVSIVAHEIRPAEEYRQRLAEHEELVHVTIETQMCHEHEHAH